MATGARGPGLRLQILVALSGLMLLAFVPLYFAVAFLTEASLYAAREQAAHALLAAIATDLEAAAGRSEAAFVHAVTAQATQPALEGLCARLEGSDPRCAGRAPAPSFLEASTPTIEAREGDLFVRTRGPRVTVFARVQLVDDALRAAPLLRLVALYTGLFALALLTFTYFVLTRLIVRPIDALAAAADRVARGARTLLAPRSGAREMDALGASLSTMTSRLLAEEEALRAKITELTRTTRSLTEAREQLVRSERLASVGRLASGLAHEIGNPLAALLGLEDLLIDGDLPAPEQRDFLQRMKRETERIHGVLRDLLDFARPETASEASPGHAVVAEVFDDVVGLLRPQKSFRGVDLVVLPAPPALTVGLARDKLTQVILNLCLNAGDAVEGKSGRVRLAVTSDAAFATLSVEDTGSGIPEAVRKRIFEPFFTTKEVGQGTGLGLAVCRGLVESAGGTIHLDEEYTAGARFLVRLPVFAV